MTRPSQSLMAAAQPSCHHLRLMSLRERQSHIDQVWRAQLLDTKRVRQHARNLQNHPAGSSMDAQHKLTTTWLLTKLFEAHQLNTTD